MGKKLPAYCYVFGCGDLPIVKVGFTRNLRQRARKVSRQAGVKLSILYSREFVSINLARAAEIAVHMRLKHYWTGHGDWFSCDAVVAASAIIKVSGELNG